MSEVGGFSEVILLTIPPGAPLPSATSLRGGSPLHIPVSGSSLPLKAIHDIAAKFTAVRKLILHGLLLPL